MQTAAPQVPPGLAAVVARLVQYAIATEHRHGPEFEIEAEAREIGALVAGAELFAHLPEPVRHTQGRKRLAELVAQGLEQRLCQCEGGHDGHPGGACPGHFDDDAVAGGVKLCPLCHEAALAVASALLDEITIRP